MRIACEFDTTTGRIKQYSTVDNLTYEMCYMGRPDVIEITAATGFDKNWTHYIEGTFYIIGDQTQRDALIRISRNQRLAASDWTQAVDVPLSEEQKQQWAVYRQALRDFPEVCDPDSPVWPVPPS